MCYDVQKMTKRRIEYAKRRGYSKDEIAELDIQFQEAQENGETPGYHVSGFSHDTLPVFTQDDPFNLQFFSWGLIPFWAKDEKAAVQISNKTINARGETIFEKPAFRNAAKSHRCLIIIDGFYEHHHANGKTYPFFIKHVEDEPLVLGGISSIWKNEAIVKETVSIVTTAGNELLAKIHNNPKMAGPRMPFILTKDQQESWLNPIESELDKKALQNMIQPFNSDELLAYPVGKIRGKYASGNTQKASEPLDYEELDLSLG
jgi:putative SOS response-associated peptidase YedK